MIPTVTKPLKDEITISAQTLHYHIERFRARGGVLPDNTLFEQWHVDIHALENSEQRFPIQIVSVAVEYASQQLNDPIIGLNHIDQDNSLYAGFGEVLQKNSDSIESFVQLCSRYFCLFTEIGIFEIIHHKPLSEIIFKPKARHLISYHQVDGALLVLLKGLERFCCTAPKMVSVDHICPKNCEVKYQEKFGCEVRFEQPINALYFDTDDVLKPVHVNDENLANSQLMPSFLELRRDKLYGKDIIEKTKYLIRRMLIKGEPSRDQVASALALSLRSFQRALSQQNTTYKALLDNTRKNTAFELLQCSSFSIQQIALLTGYSETSQFYKAFKRWFEHSPNYYRS